MTRPQPGVLADASRHAVYLTLHQSDAEGARERILSFARSRPSQVAANGQAMLMLGIGSTYWDSLYPEARPAELLPFPAMENGERVAPSTPVDLMIAVRGDDESAVYDLLREVRAELGDAVSLIEEVRGFRYKDSRDLTGFVDGTENPAPDDRAEIALVGEFDAQFAGGSYMHLQRYEHRMRSWNQTPVAAQEQIIGRTKEDNVEFASADKSPHAHTKRTSIKDAEGRSIEIYRQSMPYGDSERQGLMFISMSTSAEPFRQMLHSMVFGDEQGRADNLLLFTRALTGVSLFLPSLDWLEQH